MTCIVGVVHDGKVFIGGDSAGVDGRYGLTVRADKKVFRNGDFVMGFTSSFRMGQLLAFGFYPPKPRAGMDVMEYMVTDFIDAAPFAGSGTTGAAALEEGMRCLLIEREAEYADDIRRRLSISDIGLI